MSKARFTTSDVKAMVRDLRCNMLGKRVANVYDLSDKCYLLKFAVPGESIKDLLLLESGVRFHTTKYARSLPELPSPFCMKLRRSIRTKRLEDIKQIGVDRVVDFQFGSGESINHIILELYANGNIVLTNANYEVLALLRSHQFADDVKLKVGEIYPIVFATNVANNLDDANVNKSVLNMNVDSFRQWVGMKLNEHVEYHAHEELVAAAAFAAATAAALATQNESIDNSNKKAGKYQQPQQKRKKAKDYTIRQLLLSKDSGLSSYGPEILDHCVLKAGFSANCNMKPSTTVKDLLDFDSIVIQALLVELGKADELMNSKFCCPGQPGYIVTAADNGATAAMKSNSVADEGGNDKSCSSVADYLEFLPALFIQHEDKPHIVLSSFDAAVDEYYCRIEDQKLTREANNAELIVQKKISKIQSDHEHMLHGLVQQQSKMQRSAMLLETYAEEVGKVCIVINSALSTGMSWEDIDEMVKTETAAGNPIASLIYKLDLEHNRLTLQLNDLYEEEEEVEQDDDDEVKKEDGPESVVKNYTSSSSTSNCTGLNDASLLDSESDSGNEADSAFSSNKTNKTSKNTREVNSKNNKSSSDDSKKKKMRIDIDLSLSTYGNARSMYAQKKIAFGKEIKTVEVSAKVLQQVSDQAVKTLENQKLKRNLRTVRKIHWFEKFNWFITSEGYLVLSGRDAQQNEVLMKRYMRQEDIYVHADMSGAASCIVRAKSAQMLQQQNIRGGDAADSGTTVALIGSKVHAISPLAIQEAGIMAVSRSAAWRAKVGGVAAWWVWPSQVSKTAPSGEYLSTGSFMIYGKKNYLPPMALEMGLGIMFRLDDSSVSRHLKDWKDRNYYDDDCNDNDDAMSVLTQQFDRYDVTFDKLFNQDKIEEEEEEEKHSPSDRTAAATTDVTSLLHRSNNNNDDDGSCDKQERDNSDTEDNKNTNNAVDNNNEEEDAEEEEEDDNISDTESVTTTEKNTAKNSTSMLASLPSSRKKGKLEREEDTSMDIEIRKSATRGGGGGKKSVQLPKQQRDGKQSKKLVKFSGGGDDAKKAIADDDDDKNAENQCVKLGAPATSSNKNKIIKNKKKARRYAEQDDEDRELAMLVLGHSSAKTGEKLSEMQSKAELGRKAEDMKQRQDKAGVRYLQQSSAAVSSEASNTAGVHVSPWNQLMLLLSKPVRDAMQAIIDSGALRDGELDAHEMRALAAFTTEQGLDILGLFSEGKNLKKAGNKTGFLAGIMRRFSVELTGSKRGLKKIVRSANNSKDNNNSTIIAKSNAQLLIDESNSIKSTDVIDSSSCAIGDKDESCEDNDHNDGEDQEKEGKDINSGDSSNIIISRREQKKREQQEIQEILLEEGVLDEEEGKQADEVEKLTGCPLTEEDILLYAVPVCGPYAALQNFKFKVKLTPGAGKKGKSCKQALELFTRSKECSAVEKSLIGALTDNEVVAVMIGDVKLSMAGLQHYQQHQQAAQKKKKSRGQK